MPVPHLLILNSGGLRSLVASLAAKKADERSRLSLLHVHDGRETAAIRVRYAQRQAEALGIQHLITLELPHLYRHPGGRSTDGVPVDVMATAQLLVASMAMAQRHEASHLLWPASFQGQIDPAARATEQALLCEHLAAPPVDQAVPGSPEPLRLDTPLAEYTDEQVLSLGAQLGADFSLAWSCLFDVPRPCRACVACRRRKAAFDRAGLIDPAIVS